MAPLKLSLLSETMIGSEIVKLGGEIREKIRQGDKVYNFTVGDFDPAVFPIPVQLEEEIIEAYRRHFTNYPAAEGNLDLREAISHFIQEREQLDYTTNEILVASGGRPLIYAFFKAVCDKGDKIVYAVPSWNNNHYVHFVEGRHVVVGTSAANRFMPAAEDIRPHLKGATLLSLCSPQNPTGTTFGKEELERICDMVMEENSSRGEQEKKLYVMYDQMYWQLTYGAVTHYNPVSLRAGMRPYTIFIDAISKSFAATGVRVGWAFGPSEVMNKMKALLTHLGSWAPMAEQKAVARFLLQKNSIDSYLNDFRHGIEERLRLIYNGLMELKQEGFAVDAIAPEAAIYLTIQISLLHKTTADGAVLETQEDVTRYILNEGRLAIVPFYAFGAGRDVDWYRLSVGTCKKEEIGEMIGQLRAALIKLT